MGVSIVITSGKGGVGKTTTTDNIGTALAAIGKKVVVVDGDTGLRNLDVLMGLENRIVYTIMDVIENRCRLKQALIKDKRYPSLFLLPTAQTKDKDDIKSEDMLTIVNALKEEFDYVIIDEADSVLLDSASMPLVISGSPRVQSNLYTLTDFFVTTLVEDVHYEIEDKKVWLTNKGIEYAQRYFRIDSLYSKENFDILRHVVLALRAHFLMEKDVDYVATDEGEIVLLDKSTGRKLNGMKLRGGSHQAIEEKERQKLTELCTSLKLKITGNKGFLTAQVTNGGISLSELDPETLMSKKIKNLFSRRSY